MRLFSTLIAGLSLGIAAGTAAVGPASAGDLSYGSGLARHAAVPVPAPVPVPDVASGYYFRVDAAYSLNSVGTYKSDQPTEDRYRSDRGLDEFGRYGIGMGYYWSKWFRTDLTLDVRSEVRSTGRGAWNRNVASTSVLPGEPTSIQLRDSVYDSFRVKDYTGLVNAYVDIPALPTFTPYIGVGLGVVLHSSRGRDIQRSTTCVDVVDCDPAGNNIDPAATGLNSSFAFNGSRQREWALATAFMTGFTYKVFPSGKIDFGYRLLHLEGTSFKTPHGTALPGATIKIPDQSISEIRVGYRWDVN